MLQISSGEISQLRSEYSNEQKIVNVLDTLQECDGYIEDTIDILMMREMGIEPDKSPNRLLQKCRHIICQEEFKEDLGSGLVAAVMEILSSSCGIPPGVGTAIGIYIYKLGIKEFCNSSV